MAISYRLIISMASALMLAACSSVPVEALEQTAVTRAHVIKHDEPLPVPEELLILTFHNSTVHFRGGQFSRTCSYYESAEQTHTFTLDYCPPHMVVTRPQLKALLQLR